MSGIPHHKLEELPAGARDLVRAASGCLDDAYAPYSNFLVGCALLLDDGTVITGTNQENAAFPSGMCAERVALFAKASMYPSRAVRMIAVVARSGATGAMVPVTPCGGCRQVMLEFEARQGIAIQVVMQTNPSEWITIPSASVLLPFSFSGASLSG